MPRDHGQQPQRNTQPLGRALGQRWWRGHQELSRAAAAFVCTPQRRLTPSTARAVWLILGRQRYPSLLLAPGGAVAPSRHPGMRLVPEIPNGLWAGSPCHTPTAGESVAGPSRPRLRVAVLDEWRARPGTERIAPSGHLWASLGGRYVWPRWKFHAASVVSSWQMADAEGLRIQSVGRLSLVRRLN